MIQKTIYASIILLILQLSLIIAFNSRTTGLEVDVSGTFLENFNQDTISSIEITDGDKSTLTLEKNATGWIMPDDFSAPADTTVVTGILDKLASAQKGLAIATSPGAAKRFNTAKEKFERHILLKEGGTPVADFYLGTSAGLHHSHVRKTGEDVIYSIPISSYELSAERSEWLDKEIAKIDRKKLQKIEFNEVVLEKTGENWKLTSPESAAEDPKATQKFLDSATNITIRDIYDPDEVASLFKSALVEKLIFTMDDTNQATYSFVKKDDDYILKMSSSDLYFKVMSWQIDGLTNINQDALHQNLPAEPQSSGQSETTENEVQ